MNNPLLELPIFIRKQLAAALEGGLLSIGSSDAALSGVLGGEEYLGEVREAMELFERMGVSELAAAAWLRSLNELESRVPQLDMVWTGPRAEGFYARDTHRVYTELLSGAERSVWLSSYLFFRGARAFRALERRMEEVPELEVTILLNIRGVRGDTLSPEEQVERFAKLFWSREWRGVRRPRVYYDPRALSGEGVLHAKAVVVDGRELFVTSANFTEAAMEKNIELGLLVRDNYLAERVIAHFQGLISRKLLLPLPGE